MSTPERIIEIWFIRHAESEGNVQGRHAYAAMAAVRSFKTPTYEQISQTAILLRNNPNPKLSQLGKDQTEDMKSILLLNGFWEENEFDHCVHSPLDRAVETCLTIVHERYHVSELRTPLRCLEELTPWEHMSKRRRNLKINQFHDWLVSHPTITKLIVVGHSQYFSKLFTAKKQGLARNCDVWKAYVDIIPHPKNKTNKQCFWRDPELLHRTPLAEAHPTGDMKNTESEKSVDLLRESVVASEK